MFKILTILLLLTGVCLAQVSDDWMFYRYKEDVVKQDSNVLGVKRDTSVPIDTIYFPAPVTDDDVVRVCYPESETVTTCFNVKLEDFLECVDDNKIKPPKPKEDYPTYWPKTDTYGPYRPQD